MDYITNGKIIARLIKVERRINSIKRTLRNNEELNGDEWYEKLLGRLEAVKTELINILIDDCNISLEVVDAIIEGVEALYD